MTANGPASATSHRAAVRRQQWGWSFYDWAISGYSTVVVAALLGPYLTTMATESVCPLELVGPENKCPLPVSLDVLGIAIDPGAFYGYLLAFSIVIQVFVLPITGAIADAVQSKKAVLGVLAYTGAAATLGMFFITEHTWQLGAVLYLIAQASFGASMVVYNSYLPEIATADERDALSVRGWAAGYVGGGLLLLLNMMLLTFYAQLGVSYGVAIRIALLSAGVWWAIFALIPLLTLKDPVKPAGASVGAALLSSVRRLRETFADMRSRPQTLRFLLAYLVYNDGVQSVIGLAGFFAAKELGLPPPTILLALLVVQFVAFVGAVLLGRLARRFGAQRVVLVSLVVWPFVLGAAFFMDKGSASQFLALSVAIGLVLGGTQALSRSMFSQLVPEGKEAEYFGFYEISERGTSWLGTAAFAATYSLTANYRYSIIVLVAFFVIGYFLLARVKMREGIADAGNAQPATV